MSAMRLSCISNAVLYVVASFNLCASAFLIFIIFTQESRTRKSRYRLMIAMIAMWQVSP